MKRIHPIIAISTYGRNSDNEFPLPAEYVDSVRRAGGQPILLPPGSEDLDGILEMVDGAILSGGGDIDPHLYDSKRHPTNYKIDGERDRFELALVRALLRTGHPALYICRGAQMLNVALGGDLVQHIPDAFGNKVNHRLPGRKQVDHDIEIEPETLLASTICTAKTTIRSWHHQALNHLGEGLRAIAWAEDGVIEAVEMFTRSWMCAVQWHPELTAEKDPKQHSLFCGLVDAAREFNKG